MFRLELQLAASGRRGGFLRARSHREQCDQRDDQLDPHAHCPGSVKLPRPRAPFRTTTLLS